MPATEETKTTEKKPFDPTQMPQMCANLLGVPGIIILALNPDGTIGLLGTGVDHAQANHMLSVAIHINLSAHERMLQSQQEAKQKEALAALESASQALADENAEKEAVDNDEATQPE